MRTRFRTLLAAIAASVALTSTLTPATASDLPEPVPELVCGPTRQTPEGPVQFCARVEGKAADVGRTGEYFGAEDRYVWSDEEYQVAKACVLDGTRRASDGVEASFLGFPQFIKPTTGEVWLPGTQYGIVDGHRVARVGLYSVNDKLVYPTGPWQRWVDRGDQYPPSGTELPPNCAGY